MAQVSRDKQWGTKLGGYRYGEFTRSVLPTRLRRQLLHLQPFRSTLRRRMKYASSNTGIESLRHRLRDVLSAVDAGHVAHLVLEGVPVGAPWADDTILDAVMFYERMIDDDGASPEQAYMRLVSQKNDIGQVPMAGNFNLGGPEVVPGDFPRNVVIGGRVHEMPHSWLRERGPNTQHFLLNVMMDGYDVPDMPFPDDPAWGISDMADLLQKSYLRVADRLENPEKGSIHIAPADRGGAYGGDGSGED